MFECALSWRPSAQDPDSGKWSYKGGKNHVDTLPVSFRYGDVAFRWTEKVKGDLTELKYQLPGEELDREALITVSDDNDLQVRLHANEACLLALTGSSTLLLKDDCCDLVQAVKNSGCESLFL